MAKRERPTDGGTARAVPSAPDFETLPVFKSIADNSFVGHVIADSEGIIRYVNPYFAGLHGYAPEELIGQSISLTHTPEQLAISRRIIAEAATNGMTEPEEHWYLHRDGTVFPLLVSCVKLGSGEGEGTYTAMTAVDIAPVHQARVAYRTLFDEMLDGFAHHQIICDENGNPVDYRFLGGNPAFEAMTGLRAEDIVGKTVLEVLPTTEHRWIETYGRVALTGEPARFEDYSEALDKHFEVTAFRPAPGEFACIFQDVTESKRASQALHRSEQELLRTQRVAGLGSWTWNIADDSVEWSDGLFEMFGMPPAPRAPDFAEQERYFLPESYARLRKAVAETLETGEPYEMEAEIKRPDGDHRWLWVRGERITDDEGRPTGLWGASQDITERKRELEERLNLEAQLTRARRLEAVGTLAGGIAHDFNNMLTVILGSVERILERTDPGDSQFADLNEALQAAERSADLTRQLLAFSRNQPATPKVIDLNRSVEAVLAMLRRLIGDGVQLTWNPSREPAFVRIDPTQVDRILANLCVNARDAIGEVGEIIVEIEEVTFTEEYSDDHPDYRPGDYVRLSVSDNGAGMDAETQSHLFEPFFTTKPLGRGTGLGLPTIYGVVLQNDGFVTVESEEGVGTTFRIHLPRFAEAQTSEELPVTPSVRDRGNETILLVEDEQAILAMTTKTLEGRGYTVLAAGTPSEAIALAETHAGTIDLLLADVTLPEMNGRALADLLRASRPGLPCLYMSGYTAGAMGGGDLLDDRSAFIAKPFSLKDLAIKVRETLGD